MSNQMSWHKGRCALLIPTSEQRVEVDLVRAFAELGARQPTGLPVPGADDQSGLLSARIEQFHAQLSDEFRDERAGLTSSETGWGLRERFAKSLPALMEQEFAGASLVLLASPGLYCFMPHWLQALRQLTIAPKVVLPIPQAENLEDLPERDVAAEERPDPLAGLKRLLNLEWQTRGFDRVLVPCDEGIGDWHAWAQRIASELDLQWPIPPAVGEMGMEGIMAWGRRPAAGVDQPRHLATEVSALTRMAHGALLRIAHGENSGLMVEYAVLDRIRQALDLGDNWAVGAPSEQRDPRMDAMDKAIEGSAARNHERTPGQQPMPDALGSMIGEHEKLVQTLMSCRRELAQVRAKQEALMEQASMLPKVRLERDEIAKHLARQLSAIYWQQKGVSAFEARRSLRGRIGKILRGGRPGIHEQAMQQRWEHISMIEGSPLFDGGWYLREYADVAAADVSPAEHYLLDGAAERRNPGPVFDTAYYLTRYPDVAESGINPLVHYVSCGADEGRSIKPDSE
jgi:hypothetical protein